MKRYDAVVVGAGPSGMLLWECLSDAGLDVLLIEAGSARCADEQLPETDRLIWQYETSDGKPLLWHRVHAVGGRTLGWGGFCHRFPQMVFDDGEWPYGARALAPDYGRAERWLNMVAGSVSSEHRAAAQRLGWNFKPLRGARVNGRIWTAIDARGAGAAVGGSIAVDFDHDRGKARALRVHRIGGHEEWVAARAFALAAGPIESTRILLASRFGDVAPRIGQGLVDHQTVGWALVEPRLAVDTPGSVKLEGALLPRFVNVDAASRRPYRGGFSIEITGPQGLAQMPAIAADLGIAPREAQKLRVTFINAMGETTPHGNRRVTLSATRTDSLGRLLPVLHVARVDQDRCMIDDMSSACLAVAEALTMPGGELYPLQDDAEPGATLFHEAGTCAMGSGDRPCDQSGRLKAADNIWLADASVFPSAGDRHPTLTLLAHTFRVARAMRRNLHGGG